MQMSQYGNDASSLRIQTGTFSPNLQSQYCNIQNNQLAPPTSYNNTVLGSNVHPLTTKNNHNKKVSYFGTKAPTFKVQNSISKSQSNKNLINDKFQSQGLQLAQTQQLLQPQASVSNLMMAGNHSAMGNKSQMKMIDLINSQAKKPYESKGKKSLMNESSQLIGVNIETIPQHLASQDGQLVHYIQSRTAMDNYRQNTELNMYQKHSQSLANSNGELSRQQDYNDGTYCSMKDSLQYVVNDEALLAHQQQIHDLQKSIEKDNTLMRKKYSTDLHQLQITPSSKQFIQSQSNHQKQNSNFNQTILQPVGTNLQSPNSHEQSTAAGTVLKNKTQKLNSMLKTLINDTNPSYSQIGHISSPKLQNSQSYSSHLQSQQNLTQLVSHSHQNINQQNQNILGNNNSKINLKQNQVNSLHGGGAGSALSIHAKTTQKEGSQSKTAIQNFKKQTKGIKNSKPINIQSQVKPQNQHKAKVISTTTQKDQTSQNRRTPVSEQINNQQMQQQQHAPIQINLYSSESQLQLHQSLPQGDQYQLLMQIEQMRKEIDDLKSFKIQVHTKDLEIQQLKRKIQGLSHEKNKLRHHVSAQRAGGIGGQIDQSSGNATCEITSTSKKVDKSALSSGGGSRSYAKPFQQLVSHIKQKAAKHNKIDRHDNNISPHMNAGDIITSPIINENLIKSINQQTISTRNRKPYQSNNGVTSNHRLLNGNQLHVQSQPLLMSPTQIISGVGLIGSAKNNNHMNILQSNNIHLMNEDFRLSTEDQSPPLKLKRVISQRSIDSVSNYSSSQQKRENLRYKRSVDEWGQANDEEHQKSIQQVEQQMEKIILSEQNNNQEQLLTLSQTQETTNNLESKINNIKHVSPKRYQINHYDSQQPQMDIKMQKDLLKVKDKMQGFIQNYTQYIRYLENKIRKLQAEKSGNTSNKNIQNTMELSSHSQPAQMIPQPQHL